MKFIPAIATTTAIVSIVAWVYRFGAEHSPYQELWFYILVPATAWLLFAGPLVLLRKQRKAIRFFAALLLIPGSALWVISVLVGIYGLRIH